MTRLPRMLRAEARRYLLELRRYLVDSVASAIIISLVLVLIMKGMDWAASGNAAAGTRSSFAVSYLAWVFAFRSIQAIALGVYDEIQKGTFEQLYLSPAGVVPVLLTRAALEFASTVVLVGAVYLAVDAVAGLGFGSGFLPAILHVLSSLPGIWGLGLALAGVVLVAKKSGSLLAIASYAVIALAAVPGLPFGPLSFLPYSAGASAARAALAGGAAAPPWWPVFSLGVALAWLLAGLGAWKAAESRARRLSLFGQY